MKNVATHNSFNKKRWWRLNQSVSVLSTLSSVHKKHGSPKSYMTLTEKTSVFVLIRESEVRWWWCIVARVFYFSNFAMLSIVFAFVFQATNPTPATFATKSSRWPATCVPTWRRTKVSTETCYHCRFFIFAVLINVVTVLVAHYLRAALFNHPYCTRGDLYNQIRSPATPLTV